MSCDFRRLTPSDTGLLRALLRVFGEAFEVVDTYQKAVPSETYLRTLLQKPHFVALAALTEQDEVVVGRMMNFFLRADGVVCVLFAKQNPSYCQIDLARTAISGANR